jgi:hypothetical protein
MHQFKTALSMVSLRKTTNTLLVFETGILVTKVFTNFGMEKERSQNCAKVNAKRRAKLHDFKTLFSMLSLRETVNILFVFENVNFGSKTVQKSSIKRAKVSEFETAGI